jgi:predicted ATP-grasp superfamily ATP-dependent carboligase
MKVLVATDCTADDRKTLAAVRALGRAGAEVSVGSDIALSPPLWSRFCHDRIRYPSPVDDSGNFTSWLLAHLAEDAYQVLLPLSDYTTIPVAAQRMAFERHTRLAVPDHEQLFRAHDKLELLELARSLGIGVPETHCPGNRDELEEISGRIEYPCVFKLRRGAGAEGLAFPRSAKELLACYDALDVVDDAVFASDRPLVQEYVPGRIHDVCLLFNRGEPRAALTQQRLMMYPAAGGVGIYNETTDEPQLREVAVNLLRALNWHGPALAEFKLDNRDGRYKLMEVNARYWGTLDTAIQAGVNFPLLACQMALNGDIDPVFEYRVGLRYRWFWPQGLQYAAHSEHPWRSLRAFLRPLRGVCSDLWLSDPLPHLAQAILLARSLRR